MLCFEHQGFVGLQLPFTVLDSVFSPRSLWDTDVKNAPRVGILLPHWNLCPGSDVSPA